MLKEFKEFAVKGNMLDMAIGIVIGGAFGTIIKSFVSDILMPVISSVFNIPDMRNLFVVLRPAVDGTRMFASLEDARKAGASVLAYGNFVNAFIAFLIIAVALFFIVKAVNHLKKEEEKVEEEKGPSEIDVLIEIRDRLMK